jgi:hypothetical protein
VPKRVYAEHPNPPGTVQFDRDDDRNVAFVVTG